VHRAAGEEICRAGRPRPGRRLTCRRNRTGSELDQPADG
jgi:hypothetical protein